jgi:hypothetical protein
MSTLIVPDDDFWSRQANAQRYSFNFAPLGLRAEITANDESVLTAARLAAARYGKGEPCRDTTLHIHIIVRQQNPPPLPGDWPERLIYSGVGPWITLSAGEWGHGFGHLDLRTALLFLAPALAAETQLISRYFIDHYLLNFLFNDWAMLHASGVLDPSGQTLVLMIGAHNAGKSTTALRLLRAGYRFLADGMALMQLRHGRVHVSGYPVGEVKLRDDVLAEFPEYGGETVKVREHRKTVVSVRGAPAHSHQIVETVITPATSHLCFTERGAGFATTLTPFAPKTARDWLAANTVFWDEPARLEHNAQILNHLLETAHLHHLRLGSEPAGIISVMERLR